MAVTESAPAVPPAARTQSRPTEQGGGYEGILRRQSQRESAARTYARSLPIVPVRARGLTIEGADGRRYLDCLSGAGTLALGHNHPVVLEAIRKVLDSGAPLHVLDLATPLKDAFTSELFATLPGALADDARIQFCGPAGTDAVEAALKLVRTATGRSGLLAFTGAYHGMTSGALDASGGAADVRVTRLPYPQQYRCPFGVGGERGAELAARWTENLLDDPKSGVTTPAGMIVEAVQGEGGVIPAPDEWMRRMRRITADRSVPLVVDEVQTGVGRTGAFWAVEHSGVVPDVMVLSKAIGGSLPLAVIVYRPELDVWEPGAHAGTFRGNQLAMAAGTATLAYVRENKLAERAGTLGARILDRLQGLASAHPCVGARPTGRADGRRRPFAGGSVTDCRPPQTRATLSPAPLRHGRPSRPALPERSVLPRRMPPRYAGPLHAARGGRGQRGRAGPAASRDPASSDVDGSPSDDHAGEPATRVRLRRSADGTRRRAALPRRRPEAHPEAAGERLLRDPAEGHDHHDRPGWVVHRRRHVQGRPRQREDRQADVCTVDTVLMPEQVRPPWPGHFAGPRPSRPRPERRGAAPAPRVHATTPVRPRRTGDAPLRPRPRGGRPGPYGPPAPPTPARPGRIRSPGGHRTRTAPEPTARPGTAASDPASPAGRR